MKRFIFLIFLLYSTTLAAMEETRVDMPTAIREMGKQYDDMSNRAVEVYFRGNAKTLRDLVIPKVKERIEKVHSPLKPDSLINELKRLDVGGVERYQIHLSDEVHQLVTEAVEDALSEKEARLQELERKLERERTGRNAAIGTAIITTLGGISAALTHLSQ